MDRHEEVGIAYTGQRKGDRFDRHTTRTERTFALCSLVMRQQEVKEL